jgi:hypothetical protein
MAPVGQVHAVRPAGGGDLDQAVGDGECPRRAARREGEGAALPVGPLHHPDRALAGAGLVGEAVGAVAARQQLHQPRLIADVRVSGQAQIVDRAIEDGAHSILRGTGIGIIETANRGLPGRGQATGQRGQGCLGVKRNQFDGEVQRLPGAAGDGQQRFRGDGDILACAGQAVRDHRQAGGFDINAQNFRHSRKGGALRLVQRHLDPESCREFRDQPVHIGGGDFGGDLGQPVDRAAGWLAQGEVAVGDLIGEGEPADLAGAMGDLDALAAKPGDITVEPVGHRAAPGEPQPAPARDGYQNGASGDDGWFFHSVVPCGDGR